MPDLARELCWRHADAHLRAQPLDTQKARYALEPLVNLARLLIRAGEGEEAYRLLDRLNQAVYARADATIDGRFVSFRDLLLHGQDHHALHQWLWTVLLGDGTRALVTAQQWQNARAHVRQSKGVGLRLLDGRQIEIVATCLGGDPRAAQQTVLDSTPVEHWEKAIASCLIALCLSAAGEDLAGAAQQVTQAYMSLEPVPALAVFRQRIGLIALAFTGAHGRDQIARRLVRDAARSGDGYAAKEVLEDATCTEIMSSSDCDKLTTTVEAAGLATGSMPLHLEQALLEVVDAAVATIMAHVDGREPS
ncbi:hypothetical protein [Streptomyces murinus]|uniref:hypothetical protein n=1 Tax=Streptomyces murinus TaxID=33900 RepID=UPI003D66BB63